MLALQHPAIFQLGYDEMGGVVLAHGPPVARDGVRRSYGVPKGVMVFGVMGGGAMTGIRYFF
jgi:hypothetical protein